MILGFKERFPNGDRTLFERKIATGKKIHTIRADKNNRWEVGNLIHFTMHQRQPNQRQFAWGICVDVQPIKIIPSTKTIQVQRGAMNGGWCQLTEKEITKLAENDGFSNAAGLFDWFNKPFFGRIIFWGDVISYDHNTHGADLTKISADKLRQFMQYNGKNLY